MPDLSFLRAEIERMRYQIGRQRKEIRALHKAGIPTKAAEELLERMLAKVDELCAERDRRRNEGLPYPGTDKPSREPRSGAIGERLPAHPARRRLHAQALGRA
jgi:hypothetical protein